MKVYTVAVNSVEAKAKAEQRHPGMYAVSARPGETNEQGLTIFEVTLAPAVAPELIPGIGPSAPTVVNEAGGKQSLSKWRMDLMPPRAILAVGGVLYEGAEKYGENNWHKIPLDSHINKAIAHLYAYLAGDRSDDHLGHAACRMLMAKEKSYGDLG